ncbi:hypothetical protein ElyMa_003511100 [Elysia marginata]|uniref:Uncharacterized protein n=1 Tax=Elysia marginata TaxID=1093978 RepID=A0AAV4EF39_9GAST|nr:hypothetical protein ElyMa_003511100 [Elysia marginata]
MVVAPCEVVLEDTEKLMISLKDTSFEPRHNTPYEPDAGLPSSGEGQQLGTSSYWSDVLTIRPALCIAPADGDQPARPSLFLLGIGRSDHWP